MEKIVKNDFIFIEDNFVEIVACIIKFIQNRFEDYAFEGLELLNICAKHVDNELIDWQLAQCKEINPNTWD